MQSIPSLPVTRLVRSALRATPLLGALALLAGRGSALPQQESGVSQNRELSSIAEEQALLQRQIQRLRSTMEVLLQRVDAEGRTRTGELIRDALKTLDQREDSAGGSPLTIEERMSRAHETLEQGQLVQSIENQTQLVQDLEHLLEVLLDRKNLEALEDHIGEIQALRKDLNDLSGREQQLQQDTQGLRDSSSNQAQRDLEQAISKLHDDQRKTLSETERMGREAGTLEIEQIEKALQKLIEDQSTDTSVLEAWSPEDQERLTSARDALEKALAARSRAQRLEAAAEDLRHGAEQLSAAKDPNATQAVQQQLDAAAEHAERDARVSNDPAAQRAAKALREAQKTAQDAAEGRGNTTDAAEALDRAAQELAAASAAEDAPATEARAATREALKRLSQGSGANAAAEEARQHLDEADRAAAAGDRQRAGQETTAAAQALERALRDEGQLGEALAGSQESQGDQAEKLQRGLSTLSAAESEAGKTATSALQQAAESMHAAAQSARGDQAKQAATSARQALDALQQAAGALQSVREQAAGSQAKASAELSQAQAQLAQKAGELAGASTQGSLDPQSQQAVKEALEKAAQSMESAGQDLSQGRSASAASSQRDALQALEQAAQQASEGVRPQSGEDRQRAQDLKAEQEKIKKDILDLARRIEERKNAKKTPSMQNASDSAQRAGEDLDEGELSEAEREEERVQQELRQQEKDLQDEEDQYQRLRQDEQLFRMVGEVGSMLESHRGEMQALRELDAARKPGEDPSRAQRFQLRRIAREEDGLATRAGEISKAIEEEHSEAAAQLMRNVQEDLQRVEHMIGEEGGFQTGERGQGLQRDVEQYLVWMLDALRQEQARRQSGQQQQQQAQNQQNGQNREIPLIPDSAELKLLRSMELDLQHSLETMRKLYPELGQDGGKVDELVLDDITRLAVKHEEIAKLFKGFREKLGVPAPAGSDEEKN